MDQSYSHERSESLPVLCGFCTGLGAGTGFRFSDVWNISPPPEDRCLLGQSTNSGAAVCKHTPLGLGVEWRGSRAAGRSARGGAGEEGQGDGRAVKGRVLPGELCVPCPYPGRPEARGTPASPRSPLQLRGATHSATHTLR